MYTTLKRPPLFQPSPDSLWSDDHISKGMLQAHLNPDTDAASRRPAFIEQSAAWIASNVSESVAGRTLLDLGCGPGLYAHAFAQHGFTVHGMDISPRSIRYASEHATEAITYECSDYCQNPLPSMVDAVTLIYCDYGVLPPDVRAALLQTIARALKPGGKLFLDVFTPAHYAFFHEDSRITEIPQAGFWSPEPHLLLERFLSYPEDSTYLHLASVHTAQSPKTFYIWEHVFTSDTLQSELCAAGFTNCSFFGDLCGTPLTPTSETLAVMAQKRED